MVQAHPFLAFLLLEKKSVACYVCRLVELEFRADVCERAMFLAAVVVVAVVVVVVLGRSSIILQLLACVLFSFFFSFLVSKRLL